MTRVAIVIVTFNSGAEIGGCLDALAEIPDIEIVVIDNASSDRTRDEVLARRIRLIENPRNSGFAAAVNQGVRATTAPLILSLNPDAWLERGLEALAAHFDDPQTGAAGGLLTDGNGQPQRGFMARNLPTATTLIFESLGINRLWPGNPINWHYRCCNTDPMAIARVEQPAGAFLMFSRAAWERLGGFDERFWPAWFEDVDFCARLRRAGFPVYYNPNAVAQHTGAHSFQALTLEIRESYWYGNLLGYAAKHYDSVRFRAVCLAVALGASLRALREFPLEGVKAFAVYGAVFRLAIGHFFRLRQEHGKTVVR